CARDDGGSIFDYW
nr:immunoglobulin heavy chain junction region [Macaca mulatta]